MALTPEVQLELERLCNAGDSGDKLVRSYNSPKMVGVHCSNREGYGLNVMDVKELMEGILSVGFVASRVQAVCVELESADRRLSADFNEKLLQSAGGALGQQDAPLKYASLAGSHTNFVLRLFLDSVRCDHPEVAVDGALCLQRLKAKDIALYNACMQGLRWEVISAVVAKKVPKVLELVQRAFTAQSMSHGEPAAVQREHAFDVHDIKGSVQQFSRFRHGLLKCAYVRQNVAEQNVRAMFAKNARADVALADSIMCEMASMLQRLDEEHRSAHSLQTATGLTEMALCGHAVSLRGEGKKYKTLQGIAHDWCLVARLVTGVDFGTPWREYAEQEASAASADAMRELDAEGRLKDAGALLAELGFRSGVWADVQEFVGGAWAVFQPKSAPIFTQTDKFPPSSNGEFNAAYIHALIMQELFDLNSQHEGQGWEKLSIQCKPTKAVTATAYIPKRKLTLLPATFRVSMMPKNKKGGQGFEVLTASPTHSFWAQPVVQLGDADGKQGFITPMWFVQACGEEGDANMAIHHIPAKSDKHIRIPIMKNLKDLHEGDMLLFHKPKDTPAVAKLAISPSKRTAPVDAQHKQAKASKNK
ncbi:unnamed protein product [Effrenium voratum]|nr:unnamed protein product [Effrenium voratum]